MNTVYRVYITSRYKIQCTEYILYQDIRYRVYIISRYKIYCTEYILYQAIRYTVQSIYYIKL